MPTRADHAVGQRPWLVKRAIIERSENGARGADVLLVVARFRDAEPGRQIGQDQEGLGGTAELYRRRWELREQLDETDSDRLSGEPVRAAFRDGFSRSRRSAIGQSTMSSEVPHFAERTPERGTDR